MKIKVYPSEEQLSNMLFDHKIYGYFGSPLLYVQHKKEFNNDLLFSPEMNAKVMQRYVILVRKDSGIDQFTKLKSKNISFCTTDQVGVMYLQKLLKDKKSGDINAFF